MSFNYTPYHYRATVVRIYDADTMTLKIDLGFKINFEENFRIRGINAPEVRGPEKQEGIIARDWLRNKCQNGSQVFIETFKDKKGKYGRYLADVYFKENDEFFSVADELVKLGYAVYKNY